MKNWTSFVFYFNRHVLALVGFKDRRLMTVGFSFDDIKKLLNSIRREKDICDGGKKDQFYKSEIAEKDLVMMMLMLTNGRKGNNMVWAMVMVMMVMMMKV